MKLKTKLIATIVSMCAAIAVMAVGVWASTSQSFTVTIKNDVDVKIINVAADVYGEFAVYTQFTGQATANQTPQYAQKYGATTGTHATHVNKDHGYLLYAQGIGGYNDGMEGVFSGEDDYVSVVGGEGHVSITSGYGKYIEEAKNEVFLATSNATLANSNTSGLTNARTDNAYYATNFNVDFTTRTAQVAYMYTIRQWKMATEHAATNEMFLTVTAGNASNLTTKLNEMIAGAKLDADVVPHIYISQPQDETTWGSGEMWSELVSGTKYEIPENYTADKTYYVMVTFTFARNASNLDLSMLSDALQHQFTLEAEEGTAVAANPIPTASVTLYSAGGKKTGTSFDVTGTAFQPVWANVRGDKAAGTYPKVDSTYTAENLAKCFADASATENADLAISHLPQGFIYVGTSEGNLGTGYTWITTLNNGGTVDATTHTAVTIA